MPPYCEPSFQFDPVLFSIPLGFIREGFAFDIRWYALAYIAGLLLGWRYMVALSRRPGLWHASPKKSSTAPFTEEDVDDLLLWVTLGVIGGGRLGYVLFYNTEMIWQDPANILLGITDGGMSFHGGLIGVSLALFFTARARKLDLWRIADAAAMVTPIGLFFGRLANFINGELYGRPTDLPWGMRFASDRLCETRHPSQLYEAFLEGLVLFAVINLLAWRHKALTRPGLAAGIFLTGYGAARAIVEMVAREPDAHMPDLLRGTITMGMLLSLPMIAAGLWLIRRALNNEPVGAKA